jgi:hypothetical protein
MGLCTCLNSASIRDEHVQMYGMVLNAQRVLTHSAAVLQDGT